MKVLTAICSLLMITGCYGMRGSIGNLERPGVVTLHGKPLVLLGPALKVGDPAPEFRAVNASFKPVSLSSFRGKVVLIAAVPSLDTKVCAAETVHFNQEAANLSPKVVLIVISADLPFAQKRFCQDNGIGHLEVLSDAVWNQFGWRYGVRIKDRGLLARSIWVIDAHGILRYKQIVPELSHFPDYDAALKAARSLLH